MIKKIDILGMQLDNYTVREAMMLVENYLSGDRLNTIEYVSAQMLLSTEEDTVLRDVIASLNLAVISDREIIQVAGEATMQRIRETEENDFFQEFFKRVERNRKSIYILGETKDAIAKMKEKLAQEFPKVELCGEYAVEECVGDLEAVINDMNVKTPDVIVSVLPAPEQEHFLAEHKDKMNANVWYGIGNIGELEKKRGIRNVFRSFVRREKLKSEIAKYQVKNEA